MVDVKGRKFPGGKPEKFSFCWQNWSTLEDVDGLQRWRERFGAGYRGLLVFIYHILPVVDLPPGTPDLWHWRGRRCLMRAVPVADYKIAMRAAASKWGTVHLPAPPFAPASARSATSAILNPLAN